MRKPALFRARLGAAWLGRQETPPDLPSAKTLKNTYVLSSSAQIVDTVDGYARQGADRGIVTGLSASDGLGGWHSGASLTTGLEASQRTMGRGERISDQKIGRSKPMKTRERAKRGLCWLLDEGCNRERSDATAERRERRLGARFRSFVELVIVPECSRSFRSGRWTRLVETEMAGLEQQSR